MCYEPELFSQISCDLAQELIMFLIMGKDSQTWKFSIPKEGNTKITVSFL